MLKLNKWYFLSKFQQVYRFGNFQKFWHRFKLLNLNHLFLCKFELHQLLSFWPCHVKSLTNSCNFDVCLESILHFFAVFWNISAHRLSHSNTVADSSWSEISNWFTNPFNKNNIYCIVLQSTPNFISTRNREKKYYR
jgi:hypothetical protein